MAIPTETWLAIAALVLGYSLNLIKEGLRDRRRRLRERDAREFKLTLRAQSRKAAFQRQALTDLKEAIGRLYRLLNSPEEYDFRGDWSLKLEVIRMTILSVAAV